MNNKKYKQAILIVAGGTGGHIFPAISLYKDLIKKYSNINFITDKRGLYNNFLTEYDPEVINIKGYEGKNLIEKVNSLFLVLSSSLKSYFFLKRKKIKLVIGFGSYVQVPVLVAAKILKIDIILHEANAVLGKANKLFWRLVSHRISAYKIKLNKLETKILGTPIREEIVALYNEIYVEPLKQNKINILILGGSLGASALSHNISICLSKLPSKLRKKINIVHQVTKEHKQKVVFEYKKTNIKAEVKEFIDNVPHYLSLSHLIICRAGASTIAENLVVGMPAIYIPLKSSTGNHQYLNSKLVSDKKAAWIFDEEKLSSKKPFVSFLKKIITTDGLLSFYSRNAKLNAKKDATKDFCNLITKVLDAKF